jgi:sterol desaturase/sphingolipid hydroxylase (fatty acid hydroxylase superfamily)
MCHDSGVELDWYWTSYVALGIAFTVAELARPARKVRYFRWSAAPFDVLTLVAVQFIFVTAALYVTEPISRRIAPPTALYDVPLAVRVAIVYVVADLAAYWIHRVLHTRHLWRFHRFHHSPTQLYWLAGVRTTIPQIILTNLPITFLAPVIGDASTTVIEGLIIAQVLTNNWMHMNVTWRSQWLEKLLVTPRYHHIHHSTDAALHDGNYGVVFSVWDRLFGTYLDPDDHKPKRFGIPEKRDPILLALGV